MPLPLLRSGREDRGTVLKSYSGRNRAGRQDIEPSPATVTGCRLSGACPDGKFARLLQESKH